MTRSTTLQRALQSVGHPSTDRQPRSRFSEIVKREYGSDNWVLAARRTPNLVRRYGEDVVVLKKKEYARLQQQLEWESAPDHPARELIAKLLRRRYPAIGFIRALRAEGFKIERVRDG